jgi:hypothetical protein
MLTVAIKMNYKSASINLAASMPVSGGTLTSQFMPDGITEESDTVLAV